MSAGSFVQLSHSVCPLFFFFLSACTDTLLSSVSFCIAGAERNFTSALGPLSPASTPPIRVTESFPALVLKKVVEGGGSGDAVNCAPAKLGAIAAECRVGGPMPPAHCNTDPVSNTVTLNCKPGTGTITNITYATYGAVEGSCATGFSTAGCHSPETLGIVQALCIGKTSCALNASVQAAAHGSDPCPGKVKKLAIAATGCEAEAPHAPPAPPAPAPAPAPPPRWVVDFGQNVNGWVTLTLPAGHGLPSGTMIRIEHGEITYVESQLITSLPFFKMVLKHLDLRWGFHPAPSGAAGEKHVSNPV